MAIGEVFDGDSANLVNQIGRAELLGQAPV
jgi:hypothetical protein